MRNISFDTLKVLLAIMVVGAHTYVLIEINPQLSFYLWNGLFRVAVPLFFIMSGYYLPRVSDNAEYIQRFLKILFMYIVWMVIYSPFYIPHDIERGGVYIIKEIVVGYWHLWYLPAMMFAVLAIAFVRKIGLRTIVVLAIFLYVIGCAIQYYAFYGNSGSIPYCLYRNGFFFAVPFVIVGFIYNDIRDMLDKYKYIMLAVGGVLFAIEVYIASLHPRDIHGFDLYLSLILVCPAIFAITKSMPPFRTTMPLSKVSSAIYFIHPAFIFAAGQIGIIYGTQVFVFALAFSLLATIPMIFISRRLHFLL